MKLTKALTICILIFPVLLKAQTNSAINKVEVSYMSAANNQVIPEITIYFKNLNDISKVFLKIKDLSNNEIKYDVNYNLNDLPILNSKGQAICFKKDLFIQLLGNTPLALQGYIYEIQTENAQGIISPNYIHAEELEP